MFTNITQIIMVALAVLTSVSTVFSWLTRQQMLVNKLELTAELSKLELRLTEKLGDIYVNRQAYLSLEERVNKVENKTCPWVGKECPSGLAR